MPALISHGLADSLILPTAAKMTAAAIKHAHRFLVPDCGHSLSTRTPRVLTAT